MVMGSIGRDDGGSKFGDSGVQSSGADDLERKKETQEKVCWCHDLCLSTEKTSHSPAPSSNQSLMLMARLALNYVDREVAGAV